MVIVKLTGGIGNQMFEYTFGEQLRYLGYDVKYDISELQEYKVHAGYELENVFNLRLNYARDYELKKYKLTLWNRLLRKLNAHNSWIVQQDFSYNMKYLQLNRKETLYLDGYWQSEKYFKNIVDKVRQKFIFPELDIKNKEYLNTIQNANSVSIHVRRGDYVNHPLHGGICDLAYYQRAIEYIKQKVNNPLFVIFSNDIEWCKSNLQLENSLYIADNSGDNSYKDMQLMSYCQHNIIANSSFSWWGAWLNNHEQKLVIAPSKWFNDPNYNTKDVIPASWYQI